MQRYWLKISGRSWKKVTQDEFIKAEQRAGFFPKPDCGPMATGGFSSGITEGRVTYEKEGGKKVQLKDLEPGDMFRRPTGNFRYVKSSLKEEKGTPNYADYYCYNLDGKSAGYFMPGHIEVVEVCPIAEEEHPKPFWMLYIEGSNSPIIPKTIELPDKEEIQEWLVKKFGHVNKEIRDYLFLGVEALYMKLGGDPFIKIVMPGEKKE